MQKHHRRPLRSIAARLQELGPQYGGIFLLGAGVVLLFSSLSYTSLPLYPSGAPPEPVQYTAGMIPVFLTVLPPGLLVLAAASCFMIAGYLTLRKHAGPLPHVVIGLVVIEALAESSILGWIIKTRQMNAPLPGSRWGVLSSTWLEYLFGWPGALLLPALVLMLSYGCRRTLRKAAPHPGFFETIRVKIKTTFR